MEVLKDWYMRWNRKASTLLWWVVIVAIIASLPLAYERILTESSAKRVEFVFDYRDILDISEYKSNPAQFVDEELDAMKSAGVHSMAVYESTLDELELAQRLDLYTTREITVLDPAQANPAEKNTYVLFKGEEIAGVLQPMIEQSLREQGVGTQPWSFNDRPGLIIELPIEEATMKPLDPDPIALQQLQDKGFGIVARLSNRSTPFVKDAMDRKLSQYKEAGASTVIFEGESVPGFTGKADNVELEQMAELLQQHEMTIAAIELLRAPQRGFNTLAKELRYDVVRLHSLSEAEADRLVGNITEQEQADRIQVLADRFVLAVKDRNIRMVFLNARPSRNVERGVITDPLEPIRETLRGEDGALKRIVNEGYALGSARSFTIFNSAWQMYLKWIVVAGSVALIALTAGHFIPSLRLLSFVGGGLFSAGLFVLSSNWLYKILALGVGICAPTLGMILAIRAIRKKRAATYTGSALGLTINLFIRSLAVSLIGVAFIVGMLNNIIYSLLIDQFRGISLFSLAPIVLIGIYLLFFSEDLKFSEIVTRVKKVLSSSISVLWIVLAAGAGAVVYYYLSRTGNEGQASNFEKLFRAVLENTLGVRPRFKEFLIGHPLFILGAYLAIKYRPAGLYIFILGIFAQISVVNTFTHLHTPIYISSIRVGYGVLFGVIIGLIFIAIWELLARSWKKWGSPLLKS